MDNLFVIRLTILISSAVVMALFFTNFYAGHRVKGLLYAAVGLMSSILGFLFATLLPQANIVFFMANMFFSIGALLFLVSTQRLVNHKIYRLEIVLVTFIFSAVLVLFTLIIPMLFIRQIFVSITVIYIASRQVYILYRSFQKHKNRFILAYLVLAAFVVIIQVLRVILIVTGVNNLMFLNTPYTINIAILVFNAGIFILLALALVIATSLKTRKEMATERQLLEEWSSVDYLTKTPNRRKLYEHIEGLMQNQTSFAVVITDIDGFKKINDTYGHPVGDAVLMAYAKTVEETLDDTTFVARFGGDEFVFVYSKYKDRHALMHKVIKRILIEDLVVGDKTYHFELKSSLGIAFFPEDGSSIAELLRQADDALYRMKTQQKNQITSSNKNMKKHQRLRTPSFISNKDTT